MPNYFYLQVNSKKPVYPNSNLISIVPSDIECDVYSDLTNSTLELNSEVKKSSNIHNSSNEGNSIKYLLVFE